MAYIVNNTTGSLSIPVADGQKDTSSLSITLIGKNSPNYGESLNENMVKMLENFASTTSPSGSPLTGQLWYNTTDNTLRVYNGTSFIKAGSTITLETLPNSISYLTHVSSVSGTPDLKTVGVKGITVTPYTGNVGIGISTVAPHKLVINGQYLDPTRSLPAWGNAGDASTVPVSIHGQDGMFSILGLSSYSSVAAGHLSAFAGRRSRGTAASPAAVQTGDFLSGLFAFGHDGTAFTTTNQGVVAWYASENWSSSAHGTELVINVTRNGQLVGSNALVIKNNLDAEFAGDVVAYSASDQRLKTDIAKISNALDKVLQLDGINFKWNELSDKTDKTSNQVGILAQQVQAVLPEAVKEKSNGYLGVDYEKLVPLLIESIKELKAEIDELKKSK